ncbi:MAG: acyltransferase family protein [Bacteroidaceae bacterium]|nr:acyltransferase family protein [Bacteroidaceae bacterium]
MKERASNIELLRIIAMTFIVIWHISIHAQKGEAATHDFITATTTTGVNLFLLITGYFGLKLRWKSYLNIIAMVIFYSLLSIVINYYVFGYQPSIKDVFKAVNPFGITAYWFVDYYIILLLLSPILNIIKDRATNKEYIYLIGILVYLSCIIGLLFGRTINKNGYCIMQFITIYYIGDAIKRFKLTNRISNKYLIAIYIASTFILYIGGIFNIPGRAAYNNPILMAAAISLFCIVAKMQFASKHINSYAKCMFPVYLIHEGLFGKNIYYLLYEIGAKQNYYSHEYALSLLFYIVVLFVGAAIIENIRRAIMDKPIEMLCNFLNKRINIFP